MRRWLRRAAAAGAGSAVDRTLQVAVPGGRSAADCARGDADGRRADALRNPIMAGKPSSASKSGPICIALLRGINVGRAKRISMAELKALFEALGFRNVRTLLNSGNVVFDPGRNSPENIGRKVE